MRSEFKRVFAIAVFAIYLLGVLHHTLGLYLLAVRKLFKPNLMVRGIEFSPEFNLIPFTNTALITFNLNILLFIPFGLLLPIATKVKSFGKVILMGFLTSLLIELMQLGIGGRITDVNDLMTNTFGCLIGYGIYKIIERLRTNYEKKKV